MFTGKKLQKDKPEEAQNVSVTATSPSVFDGSKQTGPQHNPFSRPFGFSSPGFWPSSFSSTVTQGNLNKTSSVLIRPSSMTLTSAENLSDQSKQSSFTSLSPHTTLKNPGDKSVKQSSSNLFGTSSPISSFLIKTTASQDVKNNPKSTFSLSDAMNRTNQKSETKGFLFSTHIQQAHPEGLNTRSGKQSRMTEDVCTYQQSSSVVKTHNKDSTPRSTESSAEGFSFIAANQMMQSKSDCSKEEQYPVTSKRPQLVRSGIFSSTVAAAASRVKQVSPKQKEHQSEVKTPMKEERRIASPEEIQNITSIICKGILEEVNKKQVLNEHFSKFGKVRRITCCPQKNYAVIYFYDHQSAKAARDKGSLMKSGHPPLEIFWSAVQKRRSSSPRDSNVSEELKAMEGSLQEPKFLERPKAKTHTQVKQQRAQKAVKRSSHTVREREAGSVSSEALYNISAILSSSAVSSQDKYNILDARDKMIRLKHQKQSDIATAQAIVGTCPDMCPEKERFNRASKMRLSVFEVKSQCKPGESGSMDQRAMVKEYSRSSADQEEPLSHELRPPKILNMTMDYLLCNIMDRLNDKTTSPGEWYDFIWNRTRAIRKDVTQQHLCDLTSVALVEKCARFHIHCAATLCEEDMSVFDPKINNENLIKCLQTNKHFYHDLSINNITCPNEAEFRAYDILLSLREGDVLRQVQQFRPEIRDSPQVKFAIKVFSAINSNNYVRFFRLVKEATYLNACILHRYFYQVRSRAGHALLKAYCLPNHTEEFPIKELKRLLAFESEGEVRIFCSSLGLTTSNEFVTLDRSSFVIPVTTPSITRAIHLVESKRTTSVGEVVNGNPLPPNPYLSYEPHDSFDSEGRLKLEAFDASDQSCKVSALVNNSQTTTEITKHVPESTASHSNARFEPVVTREETFHQAPPFIYNNETVKDVTRDLCIEVVMKLTTDIAQETVMDQNTFLIGNSLLEESCSLMNREICKEVIKVEMELKQHEQAVAEAEAQKELEERKERVTEVICNELIDNVYKEDTHSLVKDTVEEESVILKEKLSNLSMEIILEDVLPTLSLSCAETIYAEELASWKQNLAKLKKKVEMIQLRGKVLRWRKLCATRRRLEYARMTFPACPRMLGSSWDGTSGQHMCSETFVTVYERRRKTSHLLDKEICSNLIKDKIKWTPLDLGSLVWSHLPRQSQPRYFQEPIIWKLIISLPQKGSSKSEDIDNAIVWLTTKFQKGRTLDYTKENELVTTLNQSIYQVMDNQDKVAVSVKSVTGHVKNTSDIKHHLNGMSALLVVVPMMSAANKGSVEEGLSRARQLLPSFPPNPLVPVHFLVVHSENGFQIPDEQSLLADTSLPKYAIAILKCHIHHVEASQQLAECIQWLAANTASPVNLTSKFLKDYIEDGATTYVFNYVYQDVAEKIKHQCYWQDPEPILTLYNSAMKHLASALSSSTLQQVSWPPGEFSTLLESCNIPLNWNSPSVLARLNNTVLSLQLPMVRSGKTVDDVWHYLKLVTSSVNQDKTDLISRVRHFLRSSKRRSELAGYEVIPWVDIIHACLCFLLNCHPFTKSDSEAEQIVYYLDEELESFHIPPEWSRAERSFQWNMDVCTDLSLDIRQSTPSSEKRKQIEDYLSEPPKKILSWEETQDIILPQEGTLKHLSLELKNALKAEKEESVCFMSKMEDLVKDEVVDASNNNSHSWSHQSAFSRKRSSSSPQIISPDIPWDNSATMCKLSDEDDVEVMLDCLRSSLNTQKKTNVLLEQHFTLLMDY
ncbi:germinal-center associated nuclear protein-like isoform X2 [Tachypleus tridentatus]|uniref:germinal-center associated nuclear protein-like isoform X2 n=1 Tax=Tachypleus tridentatus TaxID=6853 RepID=UPI003FD11132